MNEGSLTIMHGIWNRLEIAFALIVASLMASFPAYGGSLQIHRNLHSSRGEMLSSASKTIENNAQYEEDEDFTDEFDENITSIPDPVEFFNRKTFYVNDKLYFWILRPVAVGYGTIVPERVRTGIRRFFLNLAMPIRLVNDILQFKFKFAGIEVSRFFINTTLGVAGFMDPAEKWWHIYGHDEDFGQTLGFYGLGPGMYINWPVLGPSSLRDTVGMIGDLFMNPIAYLFLEEEGASVSIDAYRRVNEASLNIGIYESIKKEALDPYIFIRDAYHQHRNSAIME